MMTLQEIMKKHKLTEHDILCFVGIGTARASEFATRENDNEQATYLLNISKDVEKVLFNIAVTNH